MIVIRAFRKWTGGQVLRGLIGCVLWTLAAGLSPAYAERGYVTDTCSVPVQRGPAPGYKIVRMVSSGTALDVVEPTKEGYTKVKTSEGIVGWIMSEYVMNQPSARNRVTQAEARTATLESENQTLKGQAEMLDAVRNALAHCGQELATVRRTAAQTLEIDEENRRLQQEIKASRERQQQLEEETAALRNQSHRNWFIAGAGAMLGGLVCGLVIPHLPWGRRRRWDNF